MKKFKLIYIDRYFTRYKTFQYFNFDQNIESRVKEQFGWSTNIEKVLTSGEVCEISIHIISDNYLIKYGVTQHFYSKHGPEFDDKYSYLHGMNILAFEAKNKVHLKYTIQQIISLLKTPSPMNTKLKRARDLDKKEYLVPVDKPRLGVLTYTENLKEEWVKQLREFSSSVQVSDHIIDLIPDLELNEFIQYSLSRNYSYSLNDYVIFLENLFNHL